ncbi:MAG: hypothetical protein GY929_26550 [Actinomycetia bacterium]|nr:hypothetical protein [Actinomycetes bacterium]
MTRRLLVAARALLLVAVVGCSAGGEPLVLGESVTAPATGLTPTILATVVTAPSSGDGSVMTEVENGEPRPAGADDPCAAIIDGGVVQCGVVEAGPGTMVWSLDTPRPDHPGFTATVWRLVGDGLVAVLRGQEPGRQRWSAAIAGQMDLNTDGVDEIVFAFRETGSSGLVQLDVVDAASGAVVHHRSIDGGRVAVTDSGIIFWEASRTPGEPICCPTIYDEWIIEVTPGPLVESLVAAVGAPEVPEGDLAGV